MSGLIITALVFLVFIVIYQIAKAGEYANILKGEEKVQQQTNKLMAWLMVIVFFLGMWGIYKCHVDMMDKMLPIPASDHGVQYENMLLITVILTGIVFFITHFLLFYFIYRYQATGKRTAFFYPHNNRLEILWTTIPALALVVLVVVGLRNWMIMTDASPENSMKVEIVGKQFNWIIRYPGKDGVFGKTDYTKINDADNILGLDWDDPASKDDIVVQNGEMHLATNVPVHLIIKSRDVIHDVGLPHFRMKMDAVPGIITTMWFTPTISTDKMKEITNDPDFVYEIACDQLCGKGHYSMRGTVIVERSKGDMAAWLAQQQPYYSLVHTEAAPATENMPATDSTATAALSMK